MSDFIVKIWGARGSLPTPGAKTLRYGGNTSCIEVRTGEELIILDAGTGLVSLGIELAKVQNLKIHMLLSHLHWDHIQGFPFFKPAFNPTSEITIYGESNYPGSLEKMLSSQMMHPNFPITMKDLPSKIFYHDAVTNSKIVINQTEIIPVRLYHPNEAVGFKISYKGKTMFYATDTEHKDPVDQNVLEASKNADLLIYDSAYTQEEYDGVNSFSKKGWGHSTWLEGVKLSKLASVKKLILFHHDYSHDDAFMDNLEKEAQKVFPNTFAAYEGMSIEL